MTSALRPGRRMAFLPALLFLALCLTVLHAAAQAANHDNQLFAQANAAMQPGQLADAERILLELRARHPHAFPINETLGLLYAEENHLHRALPLLTAAVHESPGEAVAHANLGDALFKLGRLQPAAHELAMSAKMNPSDAATQSALAQTYMLLHKPALAVPAFEAALRQNGDDAALLYNTALACYQAGLPAKAEPLLARMPGVEESAEAQSLYGDVDEAMTHYEQAAQHYAAAARLDPSEPNIYMLGIEFMRHWTFDPAIKEFLAGVQRFPDSTRMKVGLGIAYYGGSYYDKAIPVFSNLLAQHPDNAMYAELLGRDCIVPGEGTVAQCADLASFAEKHPDNARIATYAAITMLHGPRDPKQAALARSLLVRAMQSNPKLADAHYAMGLLLQEEGKWPQSIPELETATQLKPDDAVAHYRLALAYSHAGRMQQAHEQIALQLKYSHAQRAETNARLKAVTTFLVKMK
ncbi:MULTISPECIES: tetratricopeptide repeat protein [Acidobacterium]|nr:MULTISPECIES: tetratricopeptide repeat protein [Acidobacterium]